MFINASTAQFIMSKRSDLDSERFSQIPPAQVQGCGLAKFNICFQQTYKGFYLDAVIFFINLEDSVVDPY